jgi:hypothetical protein
VKHSLHKMGGLAFSYSKSQEKACRRLTSRRQQRLTQRYEPHCIRPGQVTHRAIQASYRVFKPSKTGLPVTGKLTINTVRLLKEINDVFALLYYLVVDEEERQMSGIHSFGFVKRSLYRLKAIFSLSEDSFSHSWFIRRMFTKVNVALRQHRCLKTTKGGGSALCAQRTNWSSFTPTALSSERLCLC